jgi:HEAT repeat protein
VVALGAIRARSATDTLLDMTAASWASLRAAAMQALAAIDPDTLITALSGQDADADWSVRAELASTLSTFEPERGLPLVRLLVNDADARVIGPAPGARAARAADAETVVVRHWRTTT